MLMSFHHPDNEDALRTDIYLFCVPAHPIKIMRIIPNNGLTADRKNVNAICSKIDMNVKFCELYIGIKLRLRLDLVCFELLINETPLGKSKTAPQIYSELCEGTTDKKI